MTRFVAFLLRNWPLKVAAVLLASLLYAGRLLSSDTDLMQGRIPVLPEGIPTNAILVQGPVDIQEVRYLAPAGTPRLGPADFHPTVNLSGVPADGQPHDVGILVRPDDSRITVLSAQPSRTQVVLERIERKDVPVNVVLGTVPAGIDVGAKTATPATVTVAGPASVVDRVTAARVLVSIQPNGFNVQGEVQPEPVDVAGQVVTGRSLQVSPQTVDVRVTVFGNRQTKPLPVNPVVTGTPAAGFRISRVTVSPESITVQGDPAPLDGLEQADTASVSVSGATSTVRSEVALALPDGVLPVGDVTTVSVTVELVPVTDTRTLPAGIRLDGTVPERGYTIATPQVLLTLFGSVAELDQIASGPLVVGVDVSKLEPGTHVVPVVPVVNAGVRLVIVSPSSVAVTVTAPPSPSPAGAPSSSAVPSP